MIDPILASFVLLMIGIFLGIAGIAMTADFGRPKLGTILLFVAVVFSAPILSRLWISATL